VTTAPERERTADVERAVGDAARAAAEWREASVRDRASVLREAVRVVLDRADEIAATVSAETGKPRTEAISHDLFPALDHASWLARNVGTVLRRRRIRYTQPHLLHKRAWETYEPYGVVAVVSPWNVPFAIPFTSVATAIAAGNAVVLKPSELTPRSGELVRSVLEQAGAPRGLVSVVHGEGAVGEALVAHEQVAKVFFTGSVPVGRRVAAAAGARGCPVVLELGGKDAFVVFADADLDRAVDGALFAAFTGAGQVCVSAERIYVERPVHDEFVRRLVEGARALRPYEEVSPLITERQRAKVDALVAEAGGDVLTGGRAGDGSFYEPTVVLGPTPGAAILREEIFGPAVTVQAFETEDEAVALANASEFALGASVWTRDLRRARRVAGRVHGGMVWVNDFGYSYGAGQVSWGGAKGSGFGRSLSTHGLRECVQVKLVDEDRGWLRPAWWFPYDERTETALRNGLHVLYGDRRLRDAWRFRRDVLHLARRALGR
jgi:succinate-semialdehyde dehydrogenase/glutarate-semialdehyde dehydrogenase